jgi:hypothetical protein
MASGWLAAGIGVLALIRPVWAESANLLIGMTSARK